MKTETRVCSIAYCQNKHHAKGYCSRHWSKSRRYSNPHEEDRIERHGMSGTSIYAVWHTMKRRCENPKDQRYSVYGGRGIKVCERWSNSFSAFYEDMGDKPSPEYTLERTDNDGDYDPENCRWATKKEQSNNTRRNVFYEYNGQRKTLAQYARELGVNYYSLNYRVKSGWPIEEALTKPIRNKRKPLCGIEGESE